MRAFWYLLAASILVCSVPALSVATNEDSAVGSSHDGGFESMVVEEKRDWRKHQRKQEERRKKQEKERQNQEALRQKQEQERQRKIQDDRKKQEKERRKQEEKRRKDEEKRRKEQEKQRKEQEKRRKEEEKKRRKELEKQEKARKKQQEERRKQIEKARKKQEDARRKEEQRRKKEEKKRKKEQWDNIYRDMKNQHSGSDDYWELEEDKKEEHYPAEMKEKIKKGEKLKQEEEDTFENEFGRYKQRDETTLIDVLAAINRGNDVKDLDEGDMKKNAPRFNYKLEENAEQVFCSKKENKKKKLCSDLKKKGKKGKKGKRSLMEEYDAEEAWDRKKRDAKRDRIYLWMNRIIPYELDAVLDESEDTIRGALDEIQQKTCLRFVKHSHQTNWIKFVKKNGCWSNVGRQFWSEGFQEVSLGPNCMYKGIIMHEVMHALGFYHEQSRPDRNQYVEIFWENIMTNQQHNFNKYGYDKTDVLNVPYDYSSIMHYGKYSFAKDANKPTIQSINNPAQGLGQRSDLSPTDIQQINTLYNCHETGNGWSKWSSYGPCDDNCRKRRTRYCMDHKDKTKCPRPFSRSLLLYGLDSQLQTCTVAECNAPIDGHWNKWGDWGECSVSCGKGSHSRKRECTDPVPKNGGRSCIGLPLETRLCLKRSCSEGPYDCTFDVDEQPTCAWQHDGLADFKWIRGSGRTPSSSTGPGNDHTSKTGYYMYIEASSPTRTGWKARLVSPQIPAGERCMKIAYSMYGQGTGSVNVHVMDTETQQLTTAFTKSGDQLSKWHVAEFVLSSNNPYKVLIEAIRGINFQGDSAIDDISVQEGSCKSNKGPNPDEESPIPTVSSVGCYRDVGYINGKRPFPLLKNFRDDIVWSDYMSSLNETVLKCAAFARKNGYEYFSIEFYGECWTGPTAEINYGRDGEADDCFPEAKHGLGPFIVGAKYTHFVYKWINLPPQTPQ